MQADKCIAGIGERKNNCLDRNSSPRFAEWTAGLFAVYVGRIRVDSKGNFGSRMNNRGTDHNQRISWHTYFIFMFYVLFYFCPDQLLYIIIIYNYYILSYWIMGRNWAIGASYIYSKFSVDGTRLKGMLFTFRGILITGSSMKIQKPQSLAHAPETGHLLSRCKIIQDPPLFVR